MDEALSVVLTLFIPLAPFLLAHGFILLLARKPPSLWLVLLIALYGYLPLLPLLLGLVQFFWTFELLLAGSAGAVFLRGLLEPGIGIIRAAVLGTVQLALAWLIVPNFWPIH